MGYLAAIAVFYCGGAARHRLVFDATVPAILCLSRSTAQGSGLPVVAVGGRVNRHVMNLSNRSAIRGTLMSL